MKLIYKIWFENDGGRTFGESPYRLMKMHRRHFGQLAQVEDYRKIIHKRGRGKEAGQKRRNLAFI